MKTAIKFFSAIVISTAMMACNTNKTEETATDSLGMDSTMTTESSTATVVPGEYTDLSTGKTVYIVSDPATGWAVDSITRVPVDFYIDRSGDTLYKTGLVVNDVIMESDGKWILDETKIKRDGDDIKIKYSDGSKTKIEGDGDVKMKDADGGKTKIEDDTVKIKN